MMPWTRHELQGRYLIDSARECHVHVEALMNALTRASNRGDEDAIAAARTAIRQSALAIVRDKQIYAIQVLQPVRNPQMAEIGAWNLVDAPLGVVGQLDAWGMPIDAEIYMGDPAPGLIVPWDGIIRSWAWSPWNRRHERRARERAASVARAYAACFQSEFISHSQTVGGAVVGRSNRES